MSLGLDGCAIVAGLVGVLRRASSAVKSTAAPIASPTPNIHAPRLDTARLTSGLVALAEPAVASGSIVSPFTC